MYSFTKNTECLLCFKSHLDTEDTTVFFKNRPKNMVLVEFTSPWRDNRD